MNSQTKQCQNCKQEFRIEPEDFDFYKKIDVPPPTWCPECRMIRRFAWRNERSLYKRKCDLCQQDILAMHPMNVPFPVYCHDCWLSDKWDPTSYAMIYDFSSPFFSQLEKLVRTVPRLSLFQRAVEDSPYANVVGESKHIYLSYSTARAEDIFYSKHVDKSRYVFDSLAVTDSEQCYENIHSDFNFHSHYLVLSRNCLDSWFLYNCSNCKNCMLSENLRNGEFYIRNKKFSKEEYLREVEKLGLGSARQIERLKREFLEARAKTLQKYANITKATDSTGDNLINAKNAKVCFDSHDSEDVKYSFRVLWMKDSMDASFAIDGQRVYEYITSGKDSYEIKFSIAAFDNARDVAYTDYCKNSSYLFACVGLRNKQYCILNKQYTKEEYEALVPKIIVHMNTQPYVDKQGRVYRYGEFFPPELSPFAYNETIAQEYFPLTKAEALKQGYRWRDPEERIYTITKTQDQLPDHIKDVSDAILQDIIQCLHNQTCNEQCTKAFKIIPQELQFYRKMNLPLPRLCPNCRHYERLKQRNPLKLWHRPCMCNTQTTYQNTTTHFHNDQPCPNEFETSYAPDRPEIVYCESCYNSEIA